MATLTKIQVALNHEDPNIVLKGLEFFRATILNEHSAVQSFGYRGRGLAGKVSDLLFPPHPDRCVGTLQLFLQASPQLEELFIIWHLPGRDENRLLCAAHMDCIAAILHCSHEYHDLCRITVHRILRESSKSLHMQLTSGNLPLVHSTFGLIIEMCRTSVQNCRDVYPKLMLGSPSLASLVQRSKSISFRLHPAEEHKERNEVEDVKIQTDTRYMITLMLLTILSRSDVAIATEIFSANSIFRKIYHNMFRDNADTVKLILDGADIAFKRLSGTAMSARHSLLDSSFLKSTLGLYDSEDVSISSCAHRFMMTFCSSMHYNSVTSGVISSLVTSLQGHLDLRHREV